MTFASFKRARIVRSGWLEEGGRRLDCNPYMSGALEARDALIKLSVPKQSLGEVTKRIFHAGREGRLWVNDPEFGVPFFGSSDILNADLSPLPLIAKRQIEKNPLFSIQKGWTLITRSGTIGRMSFVRGEMSGLACSEHVLRVVPEVDCIPPGYLFAFLSSRFGVPLIVSGTYGAIIQHIEPEHIESLPVPRFDAAFETQVAGLIEEAAVQRTEASRKRQAAINEVTARLGWTGVQSFGVSNYVAAEAILRRMDAFHHSKKVAYSAAALCSDGSVRLGEIAESVFEPNRGARLKVDDPDFGIPFLSSSSVFELNPTADYLVSRGRTPNIESLLLTACDVLVPRSGQVGGIIGRAVLPLRSKVGNAGSEHLIRVRCKTEIDAAYLWAVLASEPGYWALVGTAFGSSIPSLDTGLIGKIHVPWFRDTDRQLIANLAIEAVVAQDRGNELEAQAIALIEEKIKARA